MMMTKLDSRSLHNHDQGESPSGVKVPAHGESARGMMSDLQENQGPQADDYSLALGGW